MYAVIDRADESEACCYGVYSSRADAEEIMLSEAEEWAYSVMMTEDSNDFWGERKWFWRDDYPTLMEIAIETFSIIEVPVFD